MTEDPLAAFFARASSLLKSVPEPDWDRIVDAVVDAVRRAPRGGWPVDMDTADDVASVIAVSDLVLRGALSRALGDDSSAPRNIELNLNGRHLDSIRVELAARYGSELSEVADRVRRIVTDVVEDVLGRTDASVDDVDVVITDVVQGDPRSQ